ncbi:uncharacterized protein LOC124374881 [Homalodisca vitripennis]|uniref:uncharacterized protein LOC124374881 n=1 Tax=Homalodisca vitripennis TaxID=197043 RepID=UPI001EEA051A|nr:uncharacterized protein LOC124374881 [Homalodisca vitripennis]KAG8305075.1 Coiled-coil domain-containing protein 42 [Homalodisca vitripennis]
MSVNRESIYERTSQLPADYYGGLREELGALPNNITIKLFHASQQYREAQREFIVKNIDEQRAAIYKFMDWEELHARKRVLRQLFIKSHKGIKEAKGALYRFHEKIKENNSHQHALLYAIEDVRRDAFLSNKTRIKMASFVNQYSEKFTYFLEKVAQLDPEFNSDQDILNRYEALENCRAECSELLRKELDEATELKRELQRIVEEKSTIMKKLDNSLVMLQVRRKQAKEHLMHWEHTLERIKGKMAAAMVESQTLQDGCYDLYLDMCCRKKVTPTIKKYDIENQLKFIQKTILFYKDVIRIATSVKQDQLLILKSKQHKKKINMIKSLLDTNPEDKM